MSYPTEAKITGLVCSGGMTPIDIGGQAILFIQVYGWQSSLVIECY